MRGVWVIAHRWAGLTIAFFLIVAGTTGILLPWQEELTWASRPSMAYVSPPTPGAKPLDGVTIAERVARQTGADVAYAFLDIPTDHVLRLGVQPKPGAAPLGYDTVWADPYTGDARLRFTYAKLADGAQNIMPFLYQVHYSLALGQWGIWAFGIAALVWTLDCFVGFYLTFPIRRERTGAPLRAAPGWWARWRPAWTVRAHAHGHRFNFDLHRAGGLWLWPLLLVFAWSGVGFNLPAVHRPVMAIFGAREAEMPTLRTPLATPGFGLSRAREIGAVLLAKEAARRGFAVEQPTFIQYRPANGLYRYIARTSLDVADEGGQTQIWFDARTGRLVRFQPPLGDSAADGAMRWMYLLHMAQVFGLPYRIFVSLFGALVVGLSVTGVLIWTKKRSARLLGARRRAAPAAIPALQPAE